MGGVSILRLLLSFLWIVAIVAIVPPLVATLTPLLAVMWTVGLPVMLVSSAFRAQLGVTRLGYLLYGLWWPVLLVTAIVPMLAVGLAVMQWWPALVPGELRVLFDRSGALVPEAALFFMVAGIAGVSTNFVYAFLDIPWRLKQIRQVRALPRSRVRSVAIGLAELEGTVRAIDSDTNIAPRGATKARPFYLEDDTGRILVDPGDSNVRARAQSGASLQISEIEQGLCEGDRVYVIGSVQPREGAPASALGAESLVVRPLQQRLVTSPIGRLIFPERDQPADRNAPNIFIVDKGHERDVVRRLYLALWDFCVIGAAYVAASLWLVHVAWPRLASADDYVALGRSLLDELLR